MAQKKALKFCVRHVCEAPYLTRLGSPNADDWKRTISKLHWCCEVFSIHSHQPSFLGWTFLRTITCQKDLQHPLLFLRCILADFVAPVLTPFKKHSRPLGQLAQVLKLVARMVLVPSGLFDIASTCLRLIFPQTCSDKFALKICAAWWKEPLFFGHFRLQCNCKDQSGELQRLSNQAFWRTGSLDRESCQCTFVGFRWTLQILRQDYMKFTNALKKQIQVVELFSISFPKAKTAIFPQEHPVLCPDWYRQKFFRSFAAQVLAERKELELQSGMSDVKVFSKIRRINPQVGFTFLTFVLPEKTHTQSNHSDIHVCLGWLYLL